VTTHATIDDPRTAASGRASFQHSMIIPRGLLSTGCSI
jgi:hypothetical protein